MYEAIVIYCALGSTSAIVRHQPSPVMYEVCEYRCKREQSKYHYYYPPTKIIPYGHQCPNYQKVEFERWVGKKR